MKKIKKPLRRFFVQGSFAQGVAVIAGGTALAQALGMLASPILTRLYTPDEFGVFAVYASVTAVLTVISSLRYEWAIPIEEDDENAANLLFFCLFLVVGIAFLGTMTIWFLIDHVVHLRKFLVLKPYLWILLLGTLGGGCYQVLSFWSIRKKTFGLLAQINLYQSIGRVLMQVSLGFTNLGTLGLLLGSVTGQVCANGTFVIGGWGKEWNVFRKINVGRIKYMVYRYRKFPLFSAGGSLFNVITLQIPTLLLTTFYSSEVVGWFALSQRIFGIPIMLIGNAFVQVFWGEASQLVHTNPNKLQGMYYNLSGKLLILGVAIGGVAFTSPWLFGLIFGENWVQAGVYTQYLVPMFIVQFVVSPLAQLSIYELQQWQFFWDVTRLIIVVGCFLIAYNNGWLPSKTIIMYGMVMSFMYVILFVLNAYALTIKVRTHNQEVEVEN